MNALSSRRYAEYRRKVREKLAAAKAGGNHDGSDDKTKPGSPRNRSFFKLLTEFLKLLKGHGWSVGFALATLTMATVLRLVPPLATKVVIDNVLIDEPLPQWLIAWGLPADRYQLLYWVGAFVAGLSILATIIH